MRACDRMAGTPALPPPLLTSSRLADLVAHWLLAPPSESSGVYVWHEDARGMSVHLAFAPTVRALTHDCDAVHADVYARVASEDECRRMPLAWVVHAAGDGDMGAFLEEADRMTPLRALLAAEPLAGFRPLVAHAETGLYVCTFHLLRAVVHPLVTASLAWRPQWQLPDTPAAQRVRYWALFLQYLRQVQWRQATATATTTTVDMTLSFRIPAELDGSVTFLADGQTWRVKMLCTPPPGPAGHPRSPEGVRATVDQLVHTLRATGVPNVELPRTGSASFWLQYPSSLAHVLDQRPEDMTTDTLQAFVHNRYDPPFFRTLLGVARVAAAAAARAPLSDTPPPTDVARQRARLGLYATARVLADRPPVLAEPAAMAAITAAVDARQLHALVQQVNRATRGTLLERVPHAAEVWRLAGGGLVPAEDVYEAVDFLLHMGAAARATSALVQSGRRQPKVEAPVVVELRVPFGRLTCEWCTHGQAGVTRASEHAFWHTLVLLSCGSDEDPMLAGALATTLVDTGFFRALEAAHATVATHVDLVAAASLFPLIAPPRADAWQPVQPAAAGAASSPMFYVHAPPPAQ